jgi:glycosyltransferase involved in cell wall biosynthesis
MTPASATEAPEISVLIPVWNGENEIKLCLDALMAQTLPRHQFEVVIVNNGSTDRTAEVVSRYPMARLIDEPQPGSYRARNTGLAHLRGKYVALTDADCIPAPSWLENGLVAIKQHPEVGIVGGRVDLFRVSPDDSETCEAYERLFNLNQELYIRHGHCVTANWISPVEVLKAVGGFNANLKSSGDFEMAARVRAAGYPLIYCEGAAVRHPIRGKVVDVVRKRVRVLGGQWTMEKDKLSPIRFAYRTTISGARLFLRALREGPRNPWLKAKVLGLVALLVISALGEQARLMAGGEPRRS